MKNGGEPPRAPGRAQVLVSLDVEDVITSESDDAIIWVADILARRGIRGGFFLTGDKVRTLVERGRKDVFDALRVHDLGFHSDRHSWHPTVSEYLQDQDWRSGCAEVLRRESAGVDLLRNVTGRDIWSFATPGTSWGPQIPGTVKSLGIRSHVHSFSRMQSASEPHWYAGALCFGRKTEVGPVERDLVSQGAVTSLRAQLKAQLGDVEHTADGVVHVYIGHPTMFVNEEFWDEKNFAGGMNPRPGNALSLPRKRRRRETYRMLTNLEALLDDILDYAEMTSFSEVVVARENGRVIYSANALERWLRDTTPDPFDIGSQPWSLAQIVYALARRFAGRPCLDGEVLPEVLGPVAKLGSIAQMSPPVLTGSQIVALAGQIADTADESGALPSLATVPGVSLSLASIYLTFLTRTASPDGESSPPVLWTGPNHPPIGGAIARHFVERSGSWLHADDLRVGRIADNSCAQAWSLRSAY